MKKYLNHENITRSLGKTLTYRLAIVISTFVISYWITGDKAVSLGITSVSAISNTLIYYFHERAWNSIKWGRK